MRRLLILTLTSVVLLGGSNRAEGQDAFAGVWRAGNDAHYLWIGADWNGFKSKWEALSAAGETAGDRAGCGAGEVAVGLVIGYRLST